MEHHPVQYAQLPKFEYQSFERHYQTFDRQTFQFSYYPVTATSTDNLTPAKDQDNNNPVEPEKDPAAESTPEEGSDSTPADSSASPESGGMLYLPSLHSLGPRQHVSFYLILVHVIVVLPEY